MKLTAARFLRFAPLLTLAATMALAADWPQWRGPNRDDHSPDTGLLKDWTAAPPKLVWLSKDAGLGYSGYSIVEGKLFTMGARDSDEFLIALDAQTGKELWSARVGTLYSESHGNGPRATPTVDGDRVYTLGARGGLICAQVNDGKVVWQKTMRELGGEPPDWGYTESVLVDGDKVVCTPGRAQGTIAALDKMTGKLLWQSKEVKDGAHYSSIVPVNFNGVRQFIQLVEKKVFAVNAADGKLLWQSAWPGRTAVITTPIFRDGYVYITSSYGAGCKLVKIGPDNKVTDVYLNMVMKNHHGGVVLVGDYLYGYSGDTDWICQNFKTGEQVWASKALRKGAVHYADGMLYCLEEGSGTVALIEASPKGWKEHGRFTIDPQSTQRSQSGRVWTHPVVVNGRLYLRDQESIFCYDVKAR